MSVFFPDDFDDDSAGLLIHDGPALTGAPMPMPTLPLYSPEALAILKGAFLLPTEPVTTTLIPPAPRAAIDAGRAWLEEVGLTEITAERADAVLSLLGWQWRIVPVGASGVIVQVLPEARPGEVETVPLGEAFSPASSVLSALCAACWAALAALREHCADCDPLPDGTCWPCGRQVQAEQRHECRPLGGLR